MGVKPRLSYLEVEVKERDVLIKTRVGAGLNNEGRAWIGIEKERSCCLGRVLSCDN